jgi:predicted dinucleotide-utilizing enzyme
MAGIAKYGAGDAGTVELDATMGAGAADATTLRVTIDTNQTEGSDYEDVAKDQTAQVIGSTGAIGDFLSHITIIPETTSPGAVSLLDNTGSRVIFTGGASSVSNLVPFTVNVGAASVAGAWKVTTGTNVHAMLFGNFT